MDLTSTSSCETEMCDMPNCDCLCGDCIENLVADTCQCTCHFLEDSPLKI